jgi:hypothetical protein
MDIRARQNIIPRTMAAMGRNNIAKNPGLAKYLIDRATAGWFSALHTTKEKGKS